jgi:uncharacterized protein (DUF2336 family)
MLGVLQKFLGKKETDAERRARETTLAHSGTVRQRHGLARSGHTHKEILYYLAQHDPDAKVRLAVAKNKNTPLQATKVLSTDKDVDVRLALADRLVTLLPELSNDQQSQLYAYAVQALGTLALDEMLKIRLALSSTLRDHAHAPPKVVGQLARDIERQVSEPILRFCAALSDEDLIDILGKHPSGWAISAIAGRSKLAAAVSHAVVSTYDLPANTILLGNEGAEIAENALQLIIDKARTHPEWQTPIASHKKLPANMVKALAEFADDAVRDILLARKDFDKETTEEVAAVFKRRLDFAAEQAEHEGESSVKRVKREAKEGELDEDKISDALAMRDTDFVYSAIALRIGTDADSIRRVFDLKAPKPIVALCWRASLSMRFALQMQQTLGQVQPAELLYPKGGTDYPLSVKDMEWQLEFLGLKKKAG